MAKGIAGRGARRKLGVASAVLTVGFALMACGGKSEQAQPQRHGSPTPASKTPKPDGSVPPSPHETPEMSGGDGGASSSTGGSTSGGGSVDSGGSAGAGGNAGTAGTMYDSLGGFASGGAPEFPDDDPNYPLARDLDGEGWMRCPAYPSVQGISCFHTQGGKSELCDGSNCNACLCAVPCGPAPGGSVITCPSSVGGKGVPECFGAPESGLCMLTCETGGCPPAMTCVPDPEHGRRICVWVEPI